MKYVKFGDIFVKTLVIWNAAIFLGGGVISLAILNSSFVLYVLIPSLIALVVYAFFHQAEQIKWMEERLKKLEEESKEEISHSYATYQ